MTAKQKQSLLAYLGYYLGAIDGIWGSGSKSAARAFRAAYGLKAGTTIDAADEIALLGAVTGEVKPVEKAGTDWKGVKYFRKEEFKCKCGRYCDGYPAEVDPALLELADDAREHFGAPASVSSGLRCSIHNANVGGASQSRHMSGKAMDFCIRGKSAAEVLAYVKTLKGVRYAYAINSTYVHMDVE